MTETTAAYVGLPEDLAPLRASRGDPHHRETAAIVRISNTGISITRAGIRLLGDPERVYVELGVQSRMLAIRPAPSNLGRKLQTGAFGSRIELEAQRLGIPRNRRGYALRFEPQLIEGALLIGPLPSSKRGAP